jgi:N-acetylmuramoyl-L-alanine amidase
VIKKVTASVNYDARSEFAEIDMLVFHYTGMPTLESALQRLCDPAAKVSAHYVVDLNGDIYPLVGEDKRAWHAGKSFWQGRTDINACSIGIEIVNPGHEHGYENFPGRQTEALIKLCTDVCTRHPIKKDFFLAHSDVAPERKQDPGEKFPWDALHASGLGHWQPPEPLGGGRFFQRGDHGQPVEALQAMLAMYGYNIGISGQYDEQTYQVVTAFQRHFRQDRVDGVADESTIKTLHNIIASRPE